VAAGGKLSIDMFKAVAVNELAQLGDRMLGTRPPLKLRLIVDRSKPHSLAPDGEARFWIGDVAVLCGDKIIHDPIEQRIAWTLMQFGDWECGGPYAVMSGDDDLGAIEFVWTPRERPNKEEDFEMIGTLSSMFSRYYAEQTLSKEGIIQTEADLIPDWFRPLVDAGCKSKVLPLWRFVIQPNRNVQCKEAEAVT
jgi:hypothetical protein